MNLTAKTCLVTLLIVQFSSWKSSAATSPLVNGDVLSKVLGQPELQISPTNGPAGAPVLMFAEVADEIYAATKSGLYVSRDLGESWTEIDRDEVRHKEVAEVKPFGEMLVVRVGEDSYIVRPKLDRWTKLSKVDQDRFGGYGLEQYVEFQRKLYAVSTLGIYSSSDGQQWKPSRKLSAKNIGGLKGLFADPHALYAILSGSIWRNEDPQANPRSWEKVADVGGINPPYGVAHLLDGSTVVATDTSLWISSEDGKKWTKTSLDQQGSVFPIASFDQHLIGCTHSPTWSDPPRCLLQSMDNGKTWVPLSDIPGTSDFRALVVLPDHRLTLLGGTNGVSRSTNGSLFQSANKGLGEQVCIRVFTFDGLLYAATTESLFTSNDSGKNWTPVPFQGDYSFTNMVRVGQTAFAQASKRTQDDSSLLFGSGTALFMRKSGQAGWAQVSLGNDDSRDSNEFASINTIFQFQDHLFVATTYALYKGDEAGKFELLQTEGQIKHLTSWQSRLFAVMHVRDQSGPNYGDHVVELNPDGKVVHQFTAGVKYPFLSVLVSSASGLFAGTEEGAEISYLDPSVSNASWHPVTAANLTGSITSLWLDPANSGVPSVIVVGTSDGLFFSKDSGETFTKVSVNPDYGDLQVLDMFRLPGPQFAVATDRGVVIADDKIPRGSIFFRSWRWIHDHPNFSYSTFLTVGFLVFGSSRLVLLLLQLEIPPISRVAPAFYLTTFGRWKLFRKYLRGLALDPSLKEANDRFAEVPYTLSSAGGTKSTVLVQGDTRRSLADATFDAAMKGSVVVVADAGKGKSTLCRLLVHRIAAGNYTTAGLIPVIVEGVFFDFDVVRSVTRSLLNRRAYVNEGIIASQLSNSAFLIVVDGLSEIRGEQEDAIKLLSQFIREHPDIRFVITSRNTIPGPVLIALGTPTFLSFLELDEATETAFVKKYLRRPDDSREFLELVQLNSSRVPRTPLMLRLLAETYNATGNVPRDRSTLFASYVAQILRPESTGIKAITGVQYAIRQLVRNTYLLVRGERRGFFEEDGIKVLSGLRQDLADRDVTTSPNSLLTILSQAGLLRCSNGYYTFFHDSFESYYGAFALERDLRRHELALPAACFGSPYLEETWNFVEELFVAAGDLSVLETTIVELEKLAHEKLQDLAASS